jgi:peptidoglycan hydrolase CwlO-like protein
MKSLFIMLADSNTGPVILIIALLLIAGIIGYLTAWFYAKSVYTPIIKGLEAEKSDLLKQVERLKEEVEKLNFKVEKNLERISNLEGEIGKRDADLRKKDDEIEKLVNELNRLRKPVK